MTHTAELITSLTRTEYNRLTRLKGKTWERNQRGGFSCHIRTLEPFGITVLKAEQIKTPYGNSYYCIAIINLQRIVNDGKRSLATYNSELDYPILLRNFEKFIFPVLPVRTDLSKWSLRRIDYNIDLKLSPTEVEQYITLLQRGNKHHSWEVHEFAAERKRRKESKHGNRKTTHPEGGVRYDNKQYSVNIYDKHYERENFQKKWGITDPAELEASEGILRIEIQAKKNKLNALKQKIKRDFDFDGKPIEYFARYDIAAPIIMKALGDITGRADYMTLERARNQLIQGVKSIRTQTAILKFLELVSKTRSLWRAKELYKGDIKVETILKHLNRLNINPVTIPTTFKRDTMENLFDMVALQFAEEREKAEA